MISLKKKKGKLVIVWGCVFTRVSIKFDFFFILTMFLVLYCFNMLILNIKKYYFNIFSIKKYFKKQS
jgi:hypothetical protein